MGLQLFRVSKLQNSKLQAHIKGAIAVIIPPLHTEIDPFLAPMEETGDKIQPSFCAKVHIKAWQSEFSQIKWVSSKVTALLVEKSFVALPSLHCSSARKRCTLTATIQTLNSHQSELTNELLFFTINFGCCPSFTLCSSLIEKHVLCFKQWMRKGRQV